MTKTKEKYIVVWGDYLNTQVFDLHEDALVFVDSLSVEHGGERSVVVCVSSDVRNEEIEVKIEDFT